MLMSSCLSVYPNPEITNVLHSIAGFYCNGGLGKENTYLVVGKDIQLLNVSNKCIYFVGFRLRLLFGVFYSLLFIFYLSTAKALGNCDLFRCHISIQR